MTRAIGGLVVSFLLTAHIVAAADKPVNLDLKQVTIAAAAAQISDAGGFKVDVDEAAGKDSVSLQLRGATPELALKVLAEATGLELTRVDQGYALRKPEQAKPARSDAPGWENLKRDKVKKLTYPCQHAKASEIAQYFGQVGLKSSGSDVVLEHAKPVQPTLTQAWLPATPDVDNPVLKGRQQATKATVAERLQARWDDGQKATKAPRAGGAFIALPAGISVIIGYDPSKTLIVVGKPKAVDAFLPTAQHLDAEPVAMQIGVSYLLVAPGQIDKLGLKWSQTTGPSGLGALSLATTERATITDGLARTGGTKSVDGEPLSVTAGRPVVLSLSRTLAPNVKVGSCLNVAPELAKSLAAVVTTLDLKLQAWPATGKGPCSLLIDPVYGDVVAQFADDKGQAFVSTAVPQVATLAELRRGHSLVLRGILPVGKFRAPDACPLLGELPLVGPLYRTADAAASAWDVLVVLTPAAK